jgi:hypothetical protein
MEKIQHRFKVSVADDITFSSARLLVLLRIIQERHLEDLQDLESINYIDFFASHPFIVFRKGSKEFDEINLYFSETIEYTHAGNIFSNQREKTKVVLAYLIATELIDAQIRKKKIDYQTTDKGLQISQKLDSDYYEGYGISVNYILDKIKKTKTQAEIGELQSEWLGNVPDFAKS